METSKVDNEEDVLLDPRLINESKSLCKIKIEKSSIKFLGFLFKFNLGLEICYYLVINEDIISSNRIKTNDLINISYDNELKNLNIIFDIKKRIIKSFTDLGFRITIIEILNEDNISHEYFLPVTSEAALHNRLINEVIYIPQYSDENKIIFVKGKIKDINNKEFSYYSNKAIQPGYPILLDELFLMIGITKESNKDKKENYGQIIFPLIDIIKEIMIKNRNIGKYENGKYIWEDGSYYEGELKNNLPNGKGIKYYTNGNILYEGDFINGKFEGKGKYINRKQEYYIGEFKEGLANGKGKIFYKNGNIKYDGEFINGYVEGKGKSFFENGDYYIGLWKNGLMNGKGKTYFPDGKISYDGDYVNGLEEGFGKVFFENGGYYIGQWKNGFIDGKGIEYYSNGKIRYEGNFVRGKLEGNGKLIFENNEYYVGQWKKGLRNGIGIEHYSNGNIRYEGDYVKDGLNGYGKYIWENGEYYIGQWKNYKKHGKGTYFNSNGEIINKGKWLNDEFIGN